MDLRREAIKVELTLVEVQSDEHQPRLEKAAVHAPIEALHKTQVDIEQQWERVAAVRVGPGTGPLDSRDADEAIEIGDNATAIAEGGIDCSI